jgi:hypothetical protein
VSTVAEKQSEPETKKVPPRNDLKASALYRNSRALELQNRDPDFVYQYFSVDPGNPVSLQGKTSKLHQHEYGTPRGGHVMVGAWEVVHSQSDANVRALAPREDQGKPVDTVVRYGRQVLCRIPRSEHEKYAIADAAAAEAQEREIYSPDRHTTATTDLTTVVSKDENANQMAMLKQSGHRMPGI